jgi:UDP-N-acetylmuramoylalanine--D-glutamate ligase
MASLAAAQAAGVRAEVAVPVLGAYTPPPHRCELVATHGGVDFINDSKATNLHALESALRSLDARVVLVAGGKDKGLDYRPLAPLVAERASAVVAIGEIAGLLARAWGDAVPCQTAAGLDEAVAAASRLAGPGQAVLFSPGTSSFDMFSGYEERGEAFRRAVAETISKT